jgi:Na+-transporting methylmalonyl-CoA/oxaloacetate decarboxylase gamma subunit
MKARFLVLSLLIVATMSVGAVASRGQGANGPRTSATVNFVDPVRVLDQIIMGPVLIVHDDQKMERGEACTTFYRFDPARGPQEELISFHCTPVLRTATDTTRLTFSEREDAGGCKRLLEYQIAGETEAHAIPTK